MSLNVMPKKDKDSKLDYFFDWKTENWLQENETIISHEITITPDEGLILEDSYELEGIVTVWLSGGVPESWYTVACKITTSNSPPRIDERNMKIKVVSDL